MPIATERSSRSRLKTRSREMRWVLDAQEQATTERLAQWRKRAQRWHTDAEHTRPAGCAALASRQRRTTHNEEQRLADLLAPTQQLVRPLLVIVAANTPASSGKDAVGHALLRFDRRRRGLDQRALLHHRLAAGVLPGQGHRPAQAVGRGGQGRPRHRSPAAPGREPATCRPPCPRWPRTPRAPPRRTR